MARAGNKKDGGDSGPVAKRPVSVLKPRASNLEEEIRRRAYELYEERGRGHGLDQDDWLRAEAEVRARYGVRSAS